jgi:cobaltochelatase CobS
MGIDRNATNVAVLNSYSVPDLRSILRVRVPAMRGKISTYVNKEELVGVLSGSMNAHTVRETVMARMMDEARRRGESVTYAPDDDAIPEDGITDMETAEKLAVVAEARQAEADADAGGFDISKLLKQQIDAKVQQELKRVTVPLQNQLNSVMKQLNDTLLDKQRLQQSFVDATALTNDLRLKLRDAEQMAAAVVAQPKPKVIDGAKGKMVEIMGKQYPVLDHTHRTQAEQQTITKYIEQIDGFDVAAFNVRTPLAGMEYKQGFEHLAQLLSSGTTVVMTGDRGVGKTTAVRYFASLTNWPCIRVQMNKDLTVADFVGCWEVQNGNMVWIDGPLLVAMRIGAILILDEDDRAPDEIKTILHGVLEDNATGSLVVTSKGGEVVRPHLNFRVVATGNTDGFGDVSGLYPSAHVQDAAYLDRFSARLPVTYPEKDAETRIVVAKTGLPIKTVAQMVALATATRLAKEKGEMNYPISTRSLITWGREVVNHGMAHAFCMCVLNKVPGSEQNALMTLAQANIGKEVESETKTAKPAQGM